MLARLQSDKIIGEVEVSDGHGMLIYTFINDHVGRAIGSSQTASWSCYTPYYIIDDNDRLIRKGDFTSNRPITTFLYRVIRNSEILNYYYIGFPKINDEHIRTTARIVKESRNTFKQKFNSDDFYVLIYPGHKEYGRQMAPYFEEAGIKYLDYSDLIDPTEDRFHLKEGDGNHPTAEAYSTIAARLVADIGIFESSQN